MNCAEIVKEYLKKNGYDGLCNPEIPCGCGLDDFQPCGEDFAECEPAYKNTCKTCRRDWYCSERKVINACEECAGEEV